MEQGEGDATTRVLVDTSPDMREQLLDAQVGSLDAVLFTHEHADQTHGIDDLRMVAINMRSRVNVYADGRTQDILLRRFDYCFEQLDGSQYPAILKMHNFPAPGEELSIDGKGGRIIAVPFQQDHGNVPSLGFRFGPLAYTSDAVGLPDESFDAIAGIDCWIVDCLRYDPHPTHAHLDMTLEWIERVKPQQAILTNLHFDLDYQTLKRELPRGVVPAYDGMVLEF